MDSVASASGRQLTAGTLSFWVEQTGRGPPLLLIAGLGYASWCWHELRAELKGAVALTAFDNRGAGRSDKPAGPYSIAMLADDAAAGMDAAGPGGPHRLGHSLGGYTAPMLALPPPPENPS